MKIKARQRWFVDGQDREVEMEEGGGEGKKVEGQR
jgi:hypothetical protein